MKKIIFPLIAMAVIVSVIISCKKVTSIPLQASDFPTATPPPTATATANLTPIAKTPLFDDMNDGDNQNAWGGYWYTYDDLGAPNNGTSYVVPWSDARWAAAGSAGTFFMQAPGYDTTGSAARMTGVVTNVFPYGFVGMGSALVDPKAPVNLAPCTDISFWEKGDGKNYRLKISSAEPKFSSGNGDNHYGYAFTSHAAWTLVTLPATSLTQETGWGSVVTRAEALAMATDIQFQTVGQPLASIDLWIDEIYFNGCGF